jgi:hypothetical protein
VCFAWMQLCRVLDGDAGLQGVQVLFGVWGASVNRVLMTGQEAISMQFGPGRAAMHGPLEHAIFV